ncbi:MAG: ABC transporter ATP-binding protein [Clostridium sp.]|uniref:ABC transporter ATP-binding protein n=1 Tax=Clostridium sp. TaxID=1506 RepID=UPI00302713C1
MKILSNQDKIILKWSYKYIKPYMKKLITMLVMMLLITLLVAFEPMMRAKLINNLFSLKYREGMKIVFVIAIIYILQIVISNIRYVLLTNVDASICNDLKKEAFSEILDLPIKAFDDIKKGEILSRMNGDVEEISNLFVNYSMSLIESILVMLFIGMTMIRLNIYLFLIVVITFPITYNIFKFSGVKIRKQGELYKSINDKCYGKAQQCFSGIREVVSLGIKKKMKNEMNDVLKASSNQAVKMQYTNIKANAIVQAVNNIDTIVFIMIGVILISKGKINVEVFIIFLSYSTMFSNSLADLTRVNTVVQMFLVSLERIYSLNNNLYYETVKFGNINKVKLEGDIRFESVSFGYLNNQSIIKDINFEIKKVGKIAIVGESGSGKSTIFNLLLRFYNNYKGEIFIDGINIEELSESTIRNNIAVVMQEPYLFNLSIKDNLSLCKSKINLYEIQEVCKICNIHDFIIKLPNGYETVVSEGGIGLSVGQKQRIAIARALLKKASIILFDEITSALDNESQDIINELVDYVAKEHTVIMITHRLDGIANSDKIIVLDNGRIVGNGTHEKLMTDNIKYIELFSKEK